MGTMLSGLAGGLAGLASLPAILLLIVGTLAGIVFGVIPGLGGIVLLVVLLPFLYNMSPILGLTLLLGAHSAIYYAASTTSILMNTPGAPEQAATCLDGYPMTQQGRAARALGISAVATTFGGWLGAIGLLAMIPAMLFMVTLFHPPEYLFLTILAVVLIGQLQARSATKGVLSGGLGFMLAFVGDAPSTGTTRFTFGSLSLYNGFNIAVVAVGLFAVSEMFVLFGRHSRVGLSPNTLVGGRWHEVAQGMRDVLRHKWLTVRSAAIGLLCGIIPGIGSTAANFISYGQAVRSSKHPELFGTGIPEGIVAPEASSISKEAGALVPTVALGIPNGPAMAVLLSAFAILGLEPGPSMLTQHLSLVFSMVWVLAISALLGSAIGLGLAPLLARISTIPGRVLVPLIFAVAVVGAFATTSDMTQTFALLAFGLLGLLLRRYGYSLPALIVGVVLGTTAENNLILTSQLYGWSFVKSPLADVIILVIVLLIATSVRTSRRSRKSSGQQAGERSAPPPAPRVSKQEIILDVAWVVVSAGYVALGTTFMPPANIAPTALGSLSLVAGVIQLAGAFIPSWRRATHGIEGRAAIQIGRPSDAEPETGAGDTGPAGPALATTGMAPAGPPQVAAAPAGAVATASGLAGSTVAGGAQGVSAEKERRGQWIAFLLSCGLFAAVVLFGFVAGITAFVLGYFRFVHRVDWRLMLVSAVGMGGLSYVVLYLVANALPPAGVLAQMLGLG